MACRTSIFPVSSTASGPARYLATNPDELVVLLGPALVDRPAFTGEPADALRHLLIVVDDPDYDLNASTLALGRAGVTVVHRSATPPHREQYSDPEKPILRDRADGAIERWQTGGWQPYIDDADQFGADEAAHLARQLSRWDSNPTHTGLRSAATRGATFTTLLGIPDASRLDVPDAVGAAPPRRRVARPDRRHRDRRAAGLRPEGRSRGRDGPARPDDRYDGLREVPNPDVDPVGAVDNPFRRTG